MKRHASFLILIFLFSASTEPFEASERDPILPKLDVKNCEILTQFYEIWKQSFLGASENRVERAVWIKTNVEGQFEFVRWNKTPERDTISWHGTVPEKVIALAHTHPQKVDPKPSREDGLVAARLKIPVYTISRKGIWKVTPAGEIVQEAGLLWYKEIKNSSCKDSEQAL